MNNKPSFIDLFRPEDSTTLGSAQASCRGRATVRTRTFGTVKLMLWTCVSFMLSVGISQLH